jgi:hypothetical protein
MNLTRPLHHLVSRARRNHGLEHATLNLLATKYPHRMFAGYSDPGGYWIMGEISTSELTEVALEARKLLKSGHQELAIHENCGTNLLISGLLAGLGGTLGLLGVGERRRDKLERIPLIITLATAALLIARPLGPIVQRQVTTSGDPGSLQLIQVTLHNMQGSTLHRIQTEG